MFPLQPPRAQMEPAVLCLVKTQSPCSRRTTSAGPALVLQDSDACHLLYFSCSSRRKDFFFPFRKSAVMPSFHRVMLYNTAVVKLLPCSPSATTLSHFSFRLLHFSFRELQVLLYSKYHFYPDPAEREKPFLHWGHRCWWECQTCHSLFSLLLEGPDLGNAFPTWKMINTLNLPCIFTRLKVFELSLTVNSVIF